VRIGNCGQFTTIGRLPTRGGARSPGWCADAPRRKASGACRVPSHRHGRVTYDGAGPHDDYLTQFPFPGVPNAQASGEDMTGGTPHSLHHA
jgi:hypothetical protein